MSIGDAFCVIGLVILGLDALSNFGGRYCPDPRLPWKQMFGNARKELSSEGELIEVRHWYDTATDCWLVDENKNRIRKLTHIQVACASDRYLAAQEKANDS